jgi:transcriptional antiterminator RfaH
MVFTNRNHCNYYMPVIALDPSGATNGELTAGSRPVEASGISVSGDVCASFSNELLAESSWCCLRCRRNEETLTASHLHALAGAEVFCPRIRFVQISQNRRIWVSEPLFPGYFFAKLDPGVLARSTETYGVSCLVKVGDRYAVVSGEAIRKLKRQSIATETGDPRAALVPGERWRVLDEIREGLDFVILQIRPGRERIQLLLDFFQQQAGARASADNLYPSIANGFGLLKFCARVRVQSARPGLRRGPQHRNAGLLRPVGFPPVAAPQSRSGSHPSRYKETRGSGAWET